jgi:hypothetical protein
MLFFQRVLTQSHLSGFSVAGTKSPDRVCIFVDNSNFIAQGEYVIYNKEPLNYFLYNDQIIFDYGLLFKIIKGNRDLGNIPVIVGSEISPDDSIFKERYDISVFGRNCIGREKGVDNFVTLKMAKVIYTESPGTLVLVAGDGDYYGTLLEAINYKWKVEVWFWRSGILNSLNRHEPTDLCTKHLFPVKVSDLFKLSVPLLSIGVSGNYKSDNKIHYTQLEANYKLFVYATGPNYSHNRMETLEITCDTVIEDKVIVEWLGNLNLFSWIHRKDGVIIIYFNNERELNIVKEWIGKEHKEISIWEKKVSHFNNYIQFFIN